MPKVSISGAAAAALVLLTAGVAYRAFVNEDHTAVSAAHAPAAVVGAPRAEREPATDTLGWLYGRVSTVDGMSYEGRLRMGGDQEAFWGDFFNGRRKANPWVDDKLRELLPKQRSPVEVFGIEILVQEHPIDVGRLFVTRFGDITRIESRGRDVTVTLKSGTALDCNLYDASDFDDGLEVWRSDGSFVELDSRRISSIDFLPSPPSGGAPLRLHGTVRTRQGEFRGFVQWDREECVGSDTLDGESDAGERKLPFDTIRSIARASDEASLVTLTDGSEVKLTGTNDVNEDNRGIFVDDPRYGRVLIHWDAFERVDFDPAGSGPAYEEFPAGRPLSGSVSMRDGKRLAGRIVYDLDESETTEMLDAPSGAIDYRIPFGLIASVVVPESKDERPVVTLHNGETLKAERDGDLGERNAGMLVFADGAQRGEYVLFKDVARIDFDRPAAMFPPLPAH